MKRKLLSVMGVIVGVVGVIFTYANWPMTRLPAGTKADSVLVLKGERKLILLRDNQRIKEYSIALGGDPIGKKIREGDERTPEGRYKLDYRNQDSIAHLSIRISYPDRNDIAQARAKGVSPGGALMIHGLPNGYGYFGRLHRLMDWTDGCIGVTNPEMEEIWRCVPEDAPIEIRP
jgi:murein L,D-transpeptidase YafK